MNLHIIVERKFCMYNIKSVVSLEFCSGKICSGGTKFSLKILVPGTKFSENFVPSLKKLFHN